MKLIQRIGLLFMCAVGSLAAFAQTETYLSGCNPADGRTY